MHIHGVPIGTRACVRACVHTACMHACMHACTHAWCAYGRTRVHASVRACMHACVRAFGRACVPRGVARPGARNRPQRRAWRSSPRTDRATHEPRGCYPSIHEHMCACTQMRVRTYMHVHACARTYLHAHPCVRVCVFACVHVCVCGAVRAWLGQTCSANPMPAPSRSNHPCVCVRALVRR